ncbi:MAG: PAS domain S-box protein [Methanobacteriota archaeon]
MARTPVKGLHNDIRVLLHSYPKGLSIEEISNHLSISRTTTAKYLNAMEQTGQIESRPYGPAKVYTLTERIPIENIVSLLPHLILVLDDSFIIRQANTSVLEFFNLEKSDIVGREIQYSPLGSYVNETRVEVLKRAMEGIPQFIEEDITLEGNTSFFYIRIIPTIFEYGGKGIILIFEDITALKSTQTHLEELVEARTSELEKVNKKLCEENAKYRKVREQLALKEHQYEQLVESSTDLILKFSCDGVLIYSNSQAGAILGIDHSKKKKYSLKGICIPDLPDYQEFATSLIPSLMANPEVIKKKEIAYLNEKKSIWISWTFRSIPSQSSTTLEILCIGTEITERIISEKRLIESEHQLSDILSHLPDPTFVINPQRKIIFWNKAMEEMTGVSADSVVGKERSFFTPSIFGYSRPILADFIFDSDNIDNQSLFQNLSKGEEIITAETKGVSKLGEEVIFWVKATPLKDVDGQIVGALQSMRDITTIRSLENSLIQSEGLIRGIIEASKDLIVVLDQDKRYLYINSAYEKFFGCENGDLKGLTIREHPLPGDQEFWSRVIDSHIQTRLGNRVEVSFSYDSRKICLDCYVIPFIPHSSEKIHILLDFRDVTRLKGEENTLWEDEIPLQEIGKQISRLIPTMQIKNLSSVIPILAILLFVFQGNFF